MQTNSRSQESAALPRHQAEPGEGASAPSPGGYSLIIHPSKFHCPRTGEDIRVEGSAGFQEVRVNVHGDLVAIPLEMAEQIAAEIVAHARLALAKVAAAKAAS